MYSCLVLSAGQSKRFGSPKALAPIQGTTVLQFLLQKLVDSPVDDVVVVLGAEKDRLALEVLDHTKCRIVYNKNHNLGQTSSVQEGVKNLKPPTKAFFLLPIDCPLIKVSTLATMIDVFEQSDSASIIVPRYHEKKGHPPHVPQRFFNEIMELDASSQGINVLFRAYSESVQYCDVNDSGVTQTFNTVEELQQLVQRLE